MVALTKNDKGDVLALGTNDTSRNVHNGNYIFMTDVSDLPSIVQDRGRPARISLTSHVTKKIKWFTFSRTKTNNENEVEYWEYVEESGLSIVIRIFND